MSREDLIKYIVEHDSNYDYRHVNFKYYTEKELRLIYERLKRQFADLSKNNKEN